MDVDREGAGKREMGGERDGERVDYTEKTSILALFYTFLESFILTKLLFAQS